MDESPATVRLRHRDHGPDFWRTVERAMPDYPARRDRLRRLGPDLWLPEQEPASTSAP